MKSSLVLAALLPGAAAFSTSRIRVVNENASTHNNNKFALSMLTLSEEERAREVFNSFGGETLEQAQLTDMLHALDIEATDDEAGALFKFLDQNGNGEICLDEFLPWYEEAADMAKEQATSFQSLLLSRRTVDKFLTVEVDDAVLKRAVKCAIAAPNRRGSEPWRFIKLGKETVKQVAALKARMKGAEDIDTTVQRWTQIPGWCVVTYPRSASGNNWEQREDFKSVACAIENFMLSMWSEGIGSKWTDGEIQRTREFAELCGIDPDKEKIAGVIWYGFATGGLSGADPKKRKKGVDEVLEFRP